MTGRAVWAAGAPVVAVAMRTRMAIPIAVPSWAVVLMTPEAVPLDLRATLVPRVVVATDDIPIPKPAAAMQADRAGTWAAAKIRAASPPAMTASPAAATR